MGVKTCVDRILCEDHILFHPLGRLWAKPNLELTPKRKSSLVLHQPQMIPEKITTSHCGVPDLAAQSARRLDHNQHRVSHQPLDNLEKHKDSKGFLGGHLQHPRYMMAPPRLRELGGVVKRW